MSPFPAKHKDLLPSVSEAKRGAFDEDDLLYTTLLMQNSDPNRRNINHETLFYTKHHCNSEYMSKSPVNSTDLMTYFFFVATKDQDVWHSMNHSEDKTNDAIHGPPSLTRLYTFIFHACQSCRPCID